MRTHLVMQVNFPASTSLWRVGLIVGRNTDVGINVAGQQDPSNPELDWMLLRREMATFSGATVDAARVLEYDLRAKRKMQELNQAYILALSNSTAASQTYQIFARVLIALP
jgi:hypothetical protein